MNARLSLAMLAVISIAIGACTTTKDLERRAELVAVESPASGKDDAAQGGAKEAPPASSPTANGAAGSGQSETPSSAGQGEGRVTASSGSAEASDTQKPTGQEAASALGGPAAPQGSSAPVGANPTAPPVIVEKKVYIDRPIYYPDSASQPPSRPADAVTEAMSQGVMRPKDYNGALMLYDYDSSLVYQVYSMPLRVTDIYLEPGEKLVEQPLCGDTTRWTIGGGISKTAGVDTQHLYLKPSEEGLETTLFINTDRRIYHLIIKSFKDTFMMAVMWHYPGLGIPLDFLLKASETGSRSERGSGRSAEEAENASSAIAIDPALMSSDYTVSYPKGNPPQWLPTLVVDDGAKTYIVLPDTVIHHELPAVFGENGEIVNFRVKDNVIVIDRLLRKVQLKLRDVTVEIKKKGA